jgi:hypothetical protein
MQNRARSGFSVPHAEQIIVGERYARPTRAMGAAAQLHRRPASFRYPARVLPTTSVTGRMGPIIRRSRDLSIRTLLAICVLAVPIPAVIAGCGDDDGDTSASDADPQEVLSATFDNENSISSGNVDLSVSLSTDGDESGSFDATLSGPFQGDAENPNTLPQLDWTLTASGEGSGQEIDFEGGAVVTEDNAYLEYGGEAYEVGSEDFLATKEELESQTPKNENLGFSEAFRQGCVQAARQQGGDPSTCDFDVSAWLTNQTTEGTEDVEGTDTNHVSGDLNVEQVLTDIGGIAAGFPEAEQAPFDFNSLGQFSSAVEEASFDVYSGVEDSLLRKLEFNLSIDPSAVSAGADVPVDAINVDFSLTLSEVNEPQTVEAPSDAQPIDELAGQLDLGGLGLQVPGLEGGGVPDLGGGGGAGGGGAGSDAAQAYLECISQAQTAEDQAACVSELQ